MITFKDLPPCHRTIKHDDADDTESTIAYSLVARRILYITTKEYDDCTKAVECSGQMTSLRLFLPRVMAFLSDNDIPIANVIYDWGAYLNGKPMFMGIYIFLGDDLLLDAPVAKQIQF